jgi:hypothetical protein
LRNVLLAAQVAISVILLAGAGLLVRGLQAIQHRDVGFRIDRVMVAALQLPASAYSGSRTRTFTSQLQGALAHSGDFPRIALASDAPMANRGSWTSARAAGQSSDRERMVQTHDVTGDYFDVLGIPLVDGRNFVREDAARDVVLLNQTAAARIFPGAGAVGKVIVSGKNWEVAGVVKDAYTTGFDTVEPTVYFPVTGRFGVPQLLLGDSSPATVDRVLGIVQHIEPRALIVFTPLSENFHAQLEPGPATRPSSPVRSASWRYRWPASGCPASSPTWSASAPARSECAWPSARGPAKSSEWC